MKKLISILLALLMIFSVVTVAFAADGAAVDAQDEGAVDVQGEGAEDVQGEGAEDAKKDDLLETIKDTPIGTAKTMLKIGKVVLKFVKVFVKLGMKFGLIDSEELINKIADIFGLDPETELPAGTAKAIVTII